jgi:hypothetical protein
VLQKQGVEKKIKKFEKILKFSEAMSVKKVRQT